MSVEVMRYTAVNKGNLLGFCDIFVPKMGLEFRDCAVMKKDGERWISFPARSYEKDGEKRYKGYVKFREQEHAQAFSDVVIKELDSKHLQPESSDPSEQYEDIPF